MERNSGERIVVRFGAFEVDLRTGELRRKGLKVDLQEQPFRILALLLERPGELVTREELRQKLWPDDVVVEFDQGLNNAIKKLRYALDDSAETPRFVETLPRRGYRFVAPVERVGPHLAGIETAPAGRKATGRFIRMGSVFAAVVAVGFAAILARRTSAPVPPADRDVMLAVL
ncbi:MAG TPA: winged helix-turn-helix domain-containing protein, partial [Thermoanaerobaculia bacterium]|nr:winged helix-turn-helix domain-containing protein [Thermoanaerobaculia bacterium]